MTCLLLRLAGPMQSWGVQSRFTERDTGLEPSKSGVIGLLCAAMGADREDDATLAQLASLEMGVRVDRDGVFSRDYHTAGGGTLNGRPYGVAKASGAKPQTVVSNRYYLADAEFHVALKGDRQLLEQAAAALANPLWPPFLGRKSFPPDPPLCLGFRKRSVRDALTAAPWRKRRHYDAPPDRLRLALETGPGEGAVRQDVPISFGCVRRRFGVRYVRTEFCQGFPVVDTLEALLSCT